MAVRLGEERDRAQRRAMLLIEVAGGVNETHGGFGAIHDGHALKFVFHKSPDHPIVRSQINDSQIADRQINDRQDSECGRPKLAGGEPGVPARLSTV
jgi:hypothetical protein